MGLRIVLGETKEWPWKEAAEAHGAGALPFGVEGRYPQGSFSSAG